MSSMTDFRRPDGKTAPAYYAEPEAGASAPGVVVVQEWWGLNEQIEGIADRLVEAGYRALVPDLYRGEHALDEAEAQHKMGELDFKDDATQDVRGAVQHLKESSAKVGVIGFCMGGVLAALAAMHIPETDAVVDWYGVPPEDAGDPSKITIPIQGHFGTQDQFFPPDQVDTLESKLKDGGVDYEFFRYNAKHAFGNETWKNYDAEATQQAWQRSLDFLARHLKS
jgi:carboxymethylenebutenolidase